MIMITLQMLMVLACGPLDRLRGHPVHIFKRRAVDKLAYGLALALVAWPAEPLAIPVLALALAVGMSPGWGEPMGAILAARPMQPEALEWWQKGPAAKDPWAALAVRGVIWGLPAVPVAVVFQDWSLLGFIPAFAIAMPAAMFAARLPFGRDKWGNVEFARGWIAGVIVLLGGVL